MQLSLGFNELVVDNFAGGGGASLGIERGIGRPVNAAINHNPLAISLHRANHPATAHYTEDVWRINPQQVTRSQPVGLAWFSPDCRHHSRAKGAKPLSRKIRGLAWVAVRWARRVRPRLCALENVAEMMDWGPLTPEGLPCKARKGQTFEHFVRQLERGGYRVEWRELSACDYGAPTIRKRLFLLARRDGLPIVWPTPTHGHPDSLPVQRGKMAAWPAAAECMDWSAPCPSIFSRRKPLVDNTMARVARGVVKFVLESDRVYLAPSQAPFEGCESKVAAWIIQHNGGHYDAKGGAGRPAYLPLSTITQSGAQQQLGTVSLVPAAFVAQSSRLEADAARVAALIEKHTDARCGSRAEVMVSGHRFTLVDIGMRMLSPSELYRAQGFPDDYQREFGLDVEGQPVALSKTRQVQMVGNSVCPAVAEALVRANFAHELKWRVAV
jgi:DNA (cytosine-5)-methyltransferase 1